MGESDVALVISDLGDGGAQRVLVHLATGWVAAGRRVAVVTQAGPEMDFYALPPGVRRIVAGGMGPSPNWIARLSANLRRLWLLRRAIRQAGAPIVVSFVGRTVVATILACTGLPVRHVASERNDPSRQSLGAPWDLLRRLLYRRADKITANSRGALQALAAFVPGDKLALVANPVPPPPPGRATVDDQAPLFLAVGRLTHQKAHDVLLAAFARIADQLPNWRLCIVGRGELEVPLKRLATELGIADRVDWPGQVADPYPYYRAARVLVLASRHEGMPNVLLEAMSVGLAAIVSDASPGPLEHVVHGESGLVVRVGDIDGLAHAMATLARDEPLRRRLGRAGRQRTDALRPEAVLAMWDHILGFAPIVPAARTSPAGK